MRKLTFSDCESHVDKICKSIVKSHWTPDYIVGLSRGGLVPGVMISHWLNVPFKPLEVSLRDGGYRKSSKFLSKEAQYGRNILIVDDINDSGKTFNWIINDWETTISQKRGHSLEDAWNNNVRFAVLINKIESGCDVSIDYFGADNSCDSSPKEWYSFPWEL
jgi:uncharacterized protein